MRPDGPRDPVAGPDAGPEAPYPIRLSGPVIKGFGRGSKELGIPTANIPADGLATYPSLQTGVYYGVAALDPARFVYNEAQATAETVSGDAAAAAVNPSHQTGGDEDETNENKKKKNITTILPAVLSIGYNPFYKNEVKSIEIHIMPPLTSPSPTSAPLAASESLSLSSPPPPSSTNTEPAGQFFKLPDFYSTHLNLLILGYIRPEYDYVSRDALVEDIRVDCEVARKSLEREGYVRFLADSDADAAAGGPNDKEKEARAWLRTFKL